MMLEQHIRGSRPSDYASSEVWRKRLVVVFIGVILLGAILPTIRNEFILVRMTPQQMDLATQNANAGSLVTSTGSIEKESPEYLTEQIDTLRLKELYTIPSVAVTHLIGTRVELSEMSRSR